ncbi:MAG: CoA transferase, partial [Quisquiliibacterium sp.]
LRRANAAELTGELDAAFCRQDLAYWREQLAKHRVIFSVIQRMQDIGQDQQAIDCGAVVQTDIPEMPLTIAAPIQLDGVAPKLARRAPALGEHSDEILREIGFTSAQIEHLRIESALG